MGAKEFFGEKDAYKKAKREKICSILWYSRISTRQHTKQKGANPFMKYSTADIYKMKREIINFTKNSHHACLLKERVVYPEAGGGVCNANGGRFRCISAPLQSSVPSVLSR